MPENTAVPSARRSSAPANARDEKTPQEAAE